MQNNLEKILKIIRIAKDLNVKSAAELTNFRSSYICDVENGRRKGISMNSLERFAKAYSLNISEIFSLLEYYNELPSEDPKQKYRLTLLHVLKFLEEKENALEKKVEYI